MNKKEMLEFAKNHKKELAAAGIALVGGAVVFAITKQKPVDLDKAAKVLYPVVDIEAPQLEVGTITELWQEGEWLNSIVNDIKVADCGKFGEELTKIENVTPDTTISAVMTFINE